MAISFKSPIPTPWYRQYLAQAHSHKAWAVAAMDSFLVLIRTHQHGTGMALGDLDKRPYLRLLSPPFYGGEFVHRTHVVVVGWEAQNSSRQAYGDRISYRNQLVCWPKTVNKKAGTDHVGDLVVCAKLLNLVLFQKFTSFYLIKQTTQWLGFQETNLARRFFFRGIPSQNHSLNLFALDRFTLKISNCYF